MVDTDRGRAGGGGEGEDCGGCLLSDTTVAGGDPLALIPSSSSSSSSSSSAPVSWSSTDIRARFAPVKFKIKYNIYCTKTMINSQFLALRIDQAIPYQLNHRKVCLNKSNICLMIRHYSVFLLLRRPTSKLPSEVGCGKVTNPK